MSKLDRLGWAASFTVRMGDHHLGVRPSSAQLREVLRALLAGYVVEQVQAPPNFSVRVGEDAEPGTKPLHLLYHSHTRVVRARSPRRVVDALLGRLELFADPAQPRDRLRVDALGLVGGDRAVLVPARLRRKLATIERRLNHAGLAVVDLPHVDLDVATGELIHATAGLRLDPAALAALDGWERDPQETVRPGRYPVVAWLLDGAGGQPLSRAAGVLVAAERVR
ncbi:MAG: hypothetical protein M3N52_05330, partial [Actinomycetota bacterium]|nr:hypothetical protein [Actinomycetota bacterium]